MIYMAKYSTVFARCSDVTEFCIHGHHVHTSKLRLVFEAKRTFQIYQ